MKKLLFFLVVLIVGCVDKITPNNGKLIYTYNTYQQDTFKFVSYEMHSGKYASLYRVYNGEKTGVIERVITYEVTNPIVNDSFVGVVKDSFNVYSIKLMKAQKKSMTFQDSTYIDTIPVTRTIIH
jgi:hypothetical protein